MGFAASYAQEQLQGLVQQSAGVHLRLYFDDICKPSLPDGPANLAHQHRSPIGYWHALFDRPGFCLFY